MPAAAASKTIDTASAKLAKLGLRRPEDFLLHLPMRYEDETSITPIAALSSGHPAQVEAEVSHAEVTYKPRRQLVLRVNDGSGELFLRFIHFYGSQLKTWAVGSKLRIRGEVRGGFFGAEMVHPQVKRASADQALPDTLTPVYSSIAGVPQSLIRRAIDQHLAAAEPSDYLPDAWRTQLRLWPFAKAVQTLHHPPPEINAASLQQRTHPAWQRLKFDELLAQQLSIKKATDARRAKTAPVLAVINPSDSLVTRFLARLPFVLTGAQQRVWQEILADLAQPYPMHRLLQGDVGSGKTVVAALACLHALDNGYQAALMAPTEILAEQHFRKIADWLAPLGINVIWLTGSLKKAEKTKAQTAVANGTGRLMIGTHALIQDKVRFANLGLAVIDEQHRFGVCQRLHLRSQGDGVEPHILTMSATPIPRTLAMTYFADLEVSVIDYAIPNILFTLYVSVSWTVPVAVNARFAFVDFLVKM